MPENKAKSLPANPPKLHHTTFTTLRMEQMVAWYGLVCGLRPVFQSDEASWLTNDEANHRIALLRLPGVRPPVDKPTSVGLHHTAFEYDSFAGWIDNYVRLRDAGLVPLICLDHGMTMSMYYQDPDGNGVEIQVDVFEDWAVSKEWMWASQEFSEDQIGPQFDPEKVLAAHRLGASMSEIHTRTRKGEFLPDHPRTALTFDDPWPARLAADPSLTDGVPLPPGPEN